MEQLDIDIQRSIVERETLHIREAIIKVLETSGWEYISGRHGDTVHLHFVKDIESEEDE